MAIDSKHKRMSALNFGGDDLLPPADGSVDANDRAMLLGLFSGIAIAKPRELFGAAKRVIQKRFPMPRAHPREKEWERQIAMVAMRMKNFRQQKDEAARKTAIREQQRQRVMQKEAIKLRAAQMQRERQDAKEPITRSTVRRVVKEVLDEERDK